MWQTGSLYCVSLSQQPEARSVTQGATMPKGNENVSVCGVKWGRKYRFPVPFPPCNPGKLSDHVVMPRIALCCPCTSLACWLLFCEKLAWCLPFFFAYVPSHSMHPCMACRRKWVWMLWLEEMGDSYVIPFCGFLQCDPRLPNELGWPLVCTHTGWPTKSKQQLKDNSLILASVDFLQLWVVAFSNWVLWAWRSLLI